MEEEAPAAEGPEAEAEVAEDLIEWIYPMPTCPISSVLSCHVSHRQWNYVTLISSWLMRIHFFFLSERFIFSFLHFFLFSSFFNEWLFIFWPKPGYPRAPPPPPPRSPRPLMFPVSARLRENPRRNQDFCFSITSKKTVFGVRCRFPSFTWCDFVGSPFFHRV